METFACVEMRNTTSTALQGCSQGSDLSGGGEASKGLEQGWYK